MRLSIPMHNALTAAARNPLRRTHDDTCGAPPWPAPASSLAALVRHALLDLGELRNRKGFKVTVWTITDLGHEALNPPRRLRASTKPVYMSRKGYTTDPSKSIDHDMAPGAWKPRAIDVPDREILAAFATTATVHVQERKRANGVALDAQELEQRLEQARLAARARSMDITGEAWVIRQIAATGREQAACRRLARLEAQLQQRAA